MEMEKDAKVTYSVIVILIIVLGSVAYFLQGRINLPQVQVITDDAIINNATTSYSFKKSIIPIKNNTTEKESNSKSTTTDMQLPENITSATITTNKGVIEITFSTNTPETVKNFATLALNHFYDGTRFHRVIRDFMIQGGDPLSKDLLNKDRWGTGGPGYTFKDEINTNDQFPQGTIAMANSGPNTNGSQFFIVTAITGTPWLIGKHTVFGHVTSGLETALKIQDMQTDGADRPLQDVIVEKIEIH